MNKGLVFGKFYPLHKGHIAMIEYAKSLCNELVVLVCCSDQELINSKTRVFWLEESFKDIHGITVQFYDYSETDLPNSSVASREISEQWSKVFIKQVPDVDLVVTSEQYGEYVANDMNIRHIPFDVERKKHFISASKIREDIITHWDFLPDIVKAYFQFKVVLLGTESTGKTTLTHYLVDHFNGELVSEAGRGLIPSSESFSESDLYTIAKTHAELITTAKASLAPVIIIDTDVYITQSYSQFMFAKLLDLSPKIYEQNKADLRLYLSADAPYIQDGTRMSNAKRKELDKCHKRTLQHFDISFVEISGDWQERQKQAIKIIKANLIGSNHFERQFYPVK